MQHDTIFPVNRITASNADIANSLPKSVVASTPAPDYVNIRPVTTAMQNQKSPFLANERLSHWFRIHFQK